MGKRQRTPLIAMCAKCRRPIGKRESWGLIPDVEGIVCRDCANGKEPKPFLALEKH